MLAICEAATSVSAYCLLIIIIFTLDYFGIPEDKTINTGQDIGDEVISTNECHDIMLNGL